MLAAERPVIYAGGGILKARAADALRQLAERTGIPVVTTLMARGAFPDSHPLCLGMPGMHGNYTAVTAMQRADLLVALGSRFDDRVTGKVDTFAPGAKVIHVDIDPAELGKVRTPDVGIAGDCRLVIEELLTALDEAGLHSEGSVPGTAAADRPDLGAVVGAAPPVAGGVPAPLRAGRRRRSDQAADGGRDAPRPLARRTPSWPRGWASTRCGPRSTGASTTPTPGSTPGGRGPWASPCRRPSGPRWAGPTGRCGRSTATAASR